MKKREQGILTVEASIVLTLCMLFILFLFSFARVYNAQSLVSHAVLQSSDAVALESYLREETLEGKEDAVSELANRFMGTTTVSADSYKSLRSADIPKIAKEKFVHAIGKNESEADKRLKNLGVKGGLAGVDFSGSRLDLGHDDVIICVNYTIEMQFSILGMDEIDVTKVAKSKTFGDILFNIETVAQDPVMGTASGGGKYRHGTQIEISAKASYGYKFKQWDDGNTDNPRTVTVTGAKKYTAIFEQNEFGINLRSSPDIAGSTSGSGVYKYLDVASISAYPATGYHFSKWSIYSHKDKKTKSVTDQTLTLKVDQSYTCTAIFDKNLYSVNVETSGTTSGNAYIVYNSQIKTSITAPYQEGYKLVAPSISGFKFLGWKEKGSSNYFSTSLSVYMNVPAGNITYVACYESTLRAVNFYNYNGSLYATRYVYAGNSIGGNMPQDPYYEGFRFNGWKSFNSGTIVHEDMAVYGNWVYCIKHSYGNCGVRHYFETQWWSATSIHVTPGTSGHYVNWASCTRCIYCKKLGSRNVLCGTHWDYMGKSTWRGYPYVGQNPCGSYNLD